MSTIQDNTDSPYPEEADNIPQKETEGLETQAHAIVDTNWDEYAIAHNLPVSATTFDDMELKDMVLRGVYSYGFEKPSCIQQKGIPAILTGKDLLAQAQSGTGKTATFCLGTLNQIDTSISSCQVLILAPTRELAQQILLVYNALSIHVTNIKSTACIGGTSVQEDIMTLHSGVHIVVGTPGRVQHMLDRNHLKLDYLKTFVLDEADEMLSRGFNVQIHSVLKRISESVQVCLFSATLNDETLEISTKFMKNMIKILVKREEVSLEGIKQFYISLEDERYKSDTLNDIYSLLTINQTLIYCNTKKRVEDLAASMRKHDHVVSVIHGDMTPNERKEVFKNFTDGVSRVMISTDLLARGIDVHGVNLVVNYDIPPKKESYIHRIGRGGRFGRKGAAINFVIENGDDMKNLQEICKYYTTEIVPMPNDISEYI